MTPTVAELNSLPRYIEVKVRSFLRLGLNEGIKKETLLYAKKIGKSEYSPLHHHGIGLILLKRSIKETDKTKKKYWIDHALGEFKFVIKNSPVRSFILYEVYFKIGELYFYSGDYTMASSNFRKSIYHKKDFYYAYVMLSECYTNTGLIDEAKKVLELGKQQSNIFSDAL